MLILRVLLRQGAELWSLSKDLQARLEQFKVARHQIRRRILRINKHLEKEFGEYR